MKESAFESHLHGQSSSSLAKDRRSEPRYNAENPGVIFASELKLGSRIIIRNISKGGAKLTLTENLVVPKKFFLMNFSDKSIFECELRWRDGPYVSASIVDELFGPAKRRIVGTFGHVVRSASGNNG
jgi:hypothetical protein